MHVSAICKWTKNHTKNHQRSSKNLGSCQRLEGGNDPPSRPPEVVKGWQRGEREHAFSSALRASKTHILAKTADIYLESALFFGDPLYWIIIKIAV
jgi:hypothetical protein